MTRRPFIRRFAASLPLALVLSSLGWFPVARGAGAPATVARRVPVGIESLAAPPAPGLALAGRTLRAAEAAETAEAAVCTPLWFTGVGLTWRQPAGDYVAVHVRWGEGPESLGRAVETEVLGDHSPDPGTPEYDPERRTTSFVWTGGGRCVAFSLDLPAGSAVSDVEAVLLNTSGTADGPDTEPGAAVGSALGGFLGGLLGSPGAAEAMPSKPAMVTRKQWGADESLRNCDPYYAPDGVKMGFVHHTAGTNDYGPDNSDDIVRGIYYFHTQIQGWCDIAYNFLVDRFGTVFVGRKGGAARAVVPAATQGFNTGSFAVSAMGNFEEGAVPAATLAAIERVLAWRLDVAHLPPQGWATMVSAGGSHTKYPAGTKVTMKLISGHRRTGLTACPGDNLAALLPTIRADVESMGLPKIYRPKQTRTDLTFGTDQVTFTAFASEPMSWTLQVVDAAGAAIRTLTAEGKEMAMTWKGKQDTWEPAPPGDYRVVISGISAGGIAARPATLHLTINAPPEPSPSPTPSPSESPSPSPTESPSPSPTASPTP